MGVCYQNMKKFDESIAPISKAIELNPQTSIYYMNRSYAYLQLKNIAQAKADAITAKQLGFKIPDDYAKSVGIQ